MESVVSLGFLGIKSHPTDGCLRRIRRSVVSITGSGAACWLVIVTTPGKGSRSTCRLGWRSMRHNTTLEIITCSPYWAHVFSRTVTSAGVVCVWVGVCVHPEHAWEVWCCWHLSEGPGRSGRMAICFCSWPDPPILTWEGWQHSQTPRSLSAPTLSLDKCLPLIPPPPPLLLLLTEEQLRLQGSAVNYVDY